MSTFLNFILEASISLLLFYGLYFLLLRKETNFTFARFYLLFALVSSLTLPFIPAFQTSIASSLSPISHVLTTRWLPEVVVGNAQQVALPWTALEWLLTIYFVGVAICFVRFLTEVIQLLKLIQQATVTRYEDEYVLEVEKDVPSFSFFRYIVIGNAGSLTYEEREAILTHEKMHKQQYHSMDMLLATTVNILFWFHPVVYHYKKTLIQLHEFEADSRAVKTVEADLYCSLLAKTALHSAGFTIANHFTNSLTIKRLAMIKSVKHTMAVWKKILLIPVCTLVVFMIACEDQVIADMQQVARQSTLVTEYPAEVQKVVREIKSANPDAELLVMGIVDSDKTPLDNLEKSVKVNEIRSMHVIKAMGNTAFDSYIVIEKGQTLNALATVTSEGEVFTVVEESAKPVGGFPAFYAFLAENIQYPVQALKDGITGKVFVEFVIHENGSLSDFKILKGIGSGCDEEAIRVMKLAPGWIPGKQKGKVIKQRMVLPIVFSI